jgi:thermitase
MSNRAARRTLQSAIRNPQSAIHAFLLVSALLVGAGWRLAAQAPPSYKAGQMIVLPATDTAVANLHSLGYTTIELLAGTRWRLMGVRSGLTVEQSAAELQARSDILSAHPNYLGRTFVTPNDPQFASQYQYAITRCTEAWDISQGSSSETIAIIDTGGDTKHLDLASRVVFGPGIDILDGDSDPSEPIAGTGHATNVAGMAAAISNNANDGAGMDWNAKILFVRVADVSGQVSQFDAAKGIIKAVDQKAAVLNISLGWDTTAIIDVIEDALLYARNAGRIIVAAAGNSGASTTPVAYPANSRHAIAVGSTTSSDTPASSSSFGTPSTLTGVDFAAPGENVVTTAPGFGVSTVSGTSFASPVAAGAAMLTKAVRKEYTHANFLALATATAKDLLTAGFDQASGHGRLDMLALLRHAQLSTLFPFANDSFAVRADTFAASIGETTTATASGAAGRQGRPGLNISADNLYAGYAAALGADTGTIELYLKLASEQPSDTRFIITQRGNLAKVKGNLDLVLLADSTLQFNLQDSGVVTSRTKLKSGQWYHVAVTWGPTRMILYINGESEASKATAGGPPIGETVYVGVPASFGSAKPARFSADAIRFSSRQRNIFPAALNVKNEYVSYRGIDAVNVKWTALMNETNAITVNIYADRDSVGFDGTLIGSSLSNDGQELMSLTPLATAGDSFWIYIEAIDAAFPTEKAYIYSDTSFQAFSSLESLLKASPAASDKFCIAARALPAASCGWLRAVRDSALNSAAGRLLTAIYYRLFT